MTVCVYIDIDKLQLCVVDLKRFDMRFGRRIEKVSWIDRVRSDEVLQRFEEKRNVLRTVQ